MYCGGKQAPSGAGVRLLHFVSTFGIKTDTKWLLRLLPHLRRAGFDVSIACFYGGGPLRERFEAAGVPTFDLDTPGAHDPRAILRAARLIRRLDPHIVHTHLLRADLFAGLAARCLCVPVIVSTVYALSGFRRARRRWTDGWLDGVCARLPTHTLAVCDAIRSDCITQFGMHPSAVGSIHTGIDRPPRVDANEVAELRADWGIADDDKVILTLARLSYEKGIDNLLNAASRACRNHPEARFVIAGEGPDRAALLDHARRLGIADRVRFVGFMENVWPALAAADVFCLPSLSEGMPNALLEAMACSRPIVATAVGGVPEAIESGTNGLLVRAGEPVDLADAIGRLLADSGLARRLGAAARDTIDHRFLAADVAARYARVYSHLLSQGKDAHDGGLVTQ